MTLLPTNASKLALAAEASNTFENVARQWLKNTSTDHAPSTQQKLTRWLEKDAFPYIGEKPISTISTRGVLHTAQIMKARGAIFSARKVKQICGQVFRFGVASELIERDVTADLRGALTMYHKKHYAAKTEPKQLGELLRAIHGYGGHTYAVAALKLSAMLFVRPGELRAAEWNEFDLGLGE